MKIRITYYYSDETHFSVVEDEFEDAVFGEWTHPFPNEEGNSFAFGVVECFEQSDDGGCLAEHGRIEKVKVEPA